MFDMAAHALSRYGLGARPGDRLDIQIDPQGWVTDQLAASADDSAAVDDRPTTKEAITKIYALKALEAEKSMGKDVLDQVREARNVLNETFLGDITARLEQGFTTTTPVNERLVRFWGNHFSISAENALISPAIGAFERDVIRSNLNGSFYDLLLAAESHPAMIVYLNNEQSTGPNSTAGSRRNRGLNENFSREIMELHTVGVNGGYDQADVTSFAKILTGWSVNFRLPDVAGFGEFEFDKSRHEPGAQWVMGKSYADTGEDQAKSVLQNLARHPATARFIATKLARHFVSDTPPESAIAKIEAVFLDTEGDLPSLYRAIAELPEAWAEAGTKFRLPEDYLIALGRAVGIPDTYKAYLHSIPAEMGQRTYAASRPNGWADSANDWLTGFGILRRADVAAAVTSVTSDIDGYGLMRDLYGDNLSRRTQNALLDAPHPRLTLALALASPELMYY